MYTIFIHEKPLYLSNHKIVGAQNILFQDVKNFETAIGLLQNSDLKEICIYHSDIDLIWISFQNYFKVIEAAGGIVINSQNEILLIRRNQKWDFPKGKIEKNELTEIAAIREVEEECSITNLSIEKFLLKTYHMYFDKEIILKITHWFHIRHEGSQTPTGQIEEGIDKVVWCNKIQADNFINQSFKNIQILYNNYTAI